jgi:hypothetical protein
MFAKWNLLKKAGEAIKTGKKSKEVDLQKIHDKFFDKSGKMKKKGKDIVKKGLTGLK